MYQNDKIKLNQRFGQLVYTGNSKIIAHRRYGEFSCDCGKMKYIRIDGVLGGNIHSCGCLFNKRKNSVGLSSEEYERLYNVWRNMKKRCYNENSDRYYTYGARGIVICEEWYNNFRAFAAWAVEHGWNKTLSIERKDVNGPYSPDNCVFITMSEQMRNKTSNVVIEVNGERHCLIEWCEIYGVPYKRIHRRYQLGITEPERLFYPGDLRELRGA